MPQVQLKPGQQLGAFSTFAEFLMNEFTREQEESA